MATLKARNILITGANRGLGLELVRQLVEIPYPNRQIFACCRDPDGPKSKVLQELAKKHPSVIKMIRLDVTDSGSIKEAAERVSSLLGKGGLNLLVNNSGVAANGTIQSSSADDMLSNFNTNVVGSFRVIKEFLPCLRISAKASGEQGMSCNKAAVINMSSIAASMTHAPQIYAFLPAVSYKVSKAGLNMLTICAAYEFKPDEILFTALHPGWARTDMGGQNATLDVKESIEGVIRVMSGLTEEQHGAYVDYTGKTLPW
ncbi:uncharacterized protein LOC115826921 [Chanos chanos]|uniref:Uncharacterized protein LOC115826921 n=1 Tax=Chanos chanos TaxID=29144 RepID=A0A6J2WQQ0_CHACN|nr:uncharacterized protein LOC115826921 [Chanos chanos]